MRSSVCLKDRTLLSEQQSEKPSSPELSKNERGLGSLRSEFMTANLT